MRITDWIVPIRPLADALRPLSVGIRVLIGMGLSLFVGGIAAAIFFSNSTARHTAERAANHFAAALLHDDPLTAPPGSQTYVAGLRTYFGPVYAAQLLGAHNHGVDTAQDSHTFYEADLLLGTRRGPAVIELAFDNQSLTSQRVTSVSELRPADAPGLSDGQRHALDVAFHARGGRPATATRLAGDVTSKVTAAHIVTPGAIDQVKAPPGVPLMRNPQVKRALIRLRCVQRARGDITKLQACGQG